MNGIKVLVDPAWVKEALRDEPGFSAFSAADIAALAQDLGDNLAESLALAEFVRGQARAEFETVKEDNPQIKQAAYADVLRRHCNRVLRMAEQQAPGRKGSDVLWVTREDMEWINNKLSSYGEHLGAAALWDRWPYVFSFAGPNNRGRFDAVRILRGGVKSENDFAAPESALAFTSALVPTCDIDDFDAIVCGDWDRFDGNPEKLAAAKQVAKELRDRGVTGTTLANEPQVDMGIDMEER